MSKPPTFNLFGDIVQNDADRWFESDIVPQMVVGWLAKQGEADVEININSLGGDVTAGLAIANALKAHKGKTTANVLGVAASMASVVACACDEVKMGDGAFLMIHNPWTLTVGEADDLRHEADVLDKMRDSIIGFYQSKTTKTADELKSLMDAETWLTFDDMSNAGFTVAKYTEEMKTAACATHRAFDSAPEAARRFFSAVPADWAKRFAGLQAAKDKQIAALRSEAEDATKRGVELAANIEADWKAKLDGMTAERDAAAQERDALRADIDNLKADIGEKAAALDAAKAEIEQLTASKAETEKALAETQAALAVETERYRAQVGAAMQPAEELPTLDAALAKCKTPAERSALIASGKYQK